MKINIKLGGEGVLRPPIHQIVHRGYVVTQDTGAYNVLISWMGHPKKYIPCNRILTDDELRELVDNELRILHDGRHLEEE